MTNNTVAIVLAGGSGKRWWPLTTYKALFPLMGKTVLAITLERISKTGITEAIIVTSPENYEEMKNIRLNGITISVAIQKEVNGMGGAVLAARDFVKGRPVFIVNVGDLIDESFYGILKEALVGNKPFIVGMKVENYFDTGYLKFDKDRIVGIVEKPGKGNEPSNYAVLVLDYFSNPESLFDAIEQTQSDKDDVFERALSSLFFKEVFGVIPYDGFWVPMKYPWHILDYLDHQLKTLGEHRGKNVVMKSNVVIEGDIWIGDNVKIFENTKIVGPCYIGDNTIIGNNTMIRDSHIGANCVTGFNTDIARSYIGDTCWFHSNYIGDSVLEGNISLGSGTVLANLRLDEGDIYSVVRGDRINTKRNKLGAIIARNVRVGVNTSIMPGVKIGTNSVMGAGLVIDRDIAEHTFCYGKTELVIKPNGQNIAQGNRETFRKKI